MGGEKDDELGTRWLQFGVFSPIMRLHSSNNQWNAKEPWNFGSEAQSVMIDFLRLRHRLLPYIYTMNAKAALEGTPLIQPMYWDHPNTDEAYRVPNQYLFGSELMVVPITQPQDPRLRLAKARGWLPPGRYVDIFSGAVYDGDREIWLSRSLGGYPVFAREGSIVPLDASPSPGNGGDCPGGFEILVAVGQDGKFEILEDDGTGRTVANWTATPISYTQATGTLEIGPLSSQRQFKLRFLGLAASTQVRIIVDGVEQSAATTSESNALLVDLGSVSSKVIVELGPNPQLCRPDPATMIWQILNDAQMSFHLKEHIWTIVKNGVQVVSRLHALEVDRNLLDAVLEYVL
jgi:alpha-glucosidase (family GH31 glycosyl hydrolase)